MRNFKRTLLAGAIALAVSAPAAAQFSNMYFFGDSSTDAGFYGSRFTVNPGLVWAQDLGAAYGFTIITVAKGGTDFAQGGTNINSPSLIVPTISPAAPDRPLSTQVGELLKISPTLDSNALYGVSAGYNDIFNNLTAAQLGMISPDQIGPNVALAAGQLVQQVARLNAAGARYIVVFNLYDLGRSPLGVSSPTVPYTQLVGLFNTTLQGALNQAPFQVIRVNTAQLFNEIIANPAFFGFTNVKTPACTVSTSLLCTPATLVAPGADKTYLFADDIHPTPPGYAIMAQVVDSMITGPMQMSALGEAPFRVEDATFRTLDGRMWSSLNAPPTKDKFNVWVSYDYGSIDPTNGSGHENTIAVGLDGRVNAHLLVGGVFNYTEQKGDFGGAGGGFTLKQPTGTFYFGYGDGPWYVGGTLGAGSLDYSDVNRNIVLGPSVRNENGQTRGYEYTGRLLGGYWFNWNQLLHGPYASVAYTKAIVRQFSETGSDSTALTYGQQSNEQLLWSLGWQIAGTFGAIRPWARATWEYDSMNNDRSVNAESVTLGGWYTIPAPKPDNNYALFNLGAATDFGGITGYVSGSATAARDDGNYWAVTVGVRVPF